MKYFGPVFSIIAIILFFTFFIEIKPIDEKNTGLQPAVVPIGTPGYCSDRTGGKTVYQSGTHDNFGVCRNGFWVNFTPTSTGARAKTPTPTAIFRLQQLAKPAQQPEVIRVMDRESRNIYTLYGLTDDHAGLYINKEKTQTLPRTRALYFDVGIDFSEVDGKYNEYERWVVATSPTTSVKKIEEDFTKFKSPLKGLGTYIYDQGKFYGVDPNFFMAIAYLESIYATVDSVAIRNKNPGSLRNGRGDAIKELGGFALFDSYQEGIKAFYIHLSRSYFRDFGRITVDTILWKYAPPEENDTPGYIRKTKSRMDLLREDTRVKFPSK